MLSKILKRTKKFLIEEDGPTSLEYMVMAALIIIVCLITINGIGLVTRSSLNTSSDAITEAMDR